MHFASDVPPNRSIIKVIVFYARRKTQEKTQSDDWPILVRQLHCILILQNYLYSLKTVVHCVPDNLSFFRVWRTAPWRDEFEFLLVSFRPKTQYQDIIQSCYQMSQQSLAASWLFDNTKQPLPVFHLELRRQRLIPLLDLFCSAFLGLLNRIKSMMGLHG